MNKRDRVNVDLDLGGLDMFQKKVEKVGNINDIVLLDLFGEDLLIKLVTTFQISNQEDLNKLDGELLDNFIKVNTDYQTFEEFSLGKAKEYIFKQLFN